MNIYLKILLYVTLGLIIILIILSSMNLSLRTYSNQKKEIMSGIIDTPKTIQEDDLIGLPIPIQEYLRTVGVIGKETVSSYHIEFTGEMSMNGTYYPIEGVQTSTTYNHARLFYMRMSMFNMKIAGLHSFIDDASMKIKLLDIFNVVNESGGVMNQSETVTILNDLVLFAPHFLINDQFTYIVIDDYTVDVTFTRDDVTVTATLIFDEEYKIVNFITSDRYAFVDGVNVQARWETPMYSYQTIDGLLLPKTGSAIYYYEDGEVDEYIKLDIQDITYNE